MPRNFMAITTDKNNCVSNSNDVVSVPASYRLQTQNRGKGPTDNGSGVMLLFLCVIDVEVHKRERVWTDECESKLRYSKNNILASSKSKHYDSVGQYYSFGNKCNFGMVNNSSVGMYATKPYLNSDSDIKAKNYAELMEENAAIEVVTAVKGLWGIIPNIHMLISPVVDVAYNIQSKHENINLQIVQKTRPGLWQSKVCVNASTDKWHTENDVSYTLISVPK